jgi:hypothetical protein
MFPPIIGAFIGMKLDVGAWKGVGAKLFDDGLKLGVKACTCAFRAGIASLLRGLKSFLTCIPLQETRRYG